MRAIVAQGALSPLNFLELDTSAKNAEGIGDAVGGLVVERRGDSRLLECCSSRNAPRCRLLLALGAVGPGVEGGRLLCCGGGLVVSVGAAQLLVLRRVGVLRGVVALVEAGSGGRSLRRAHGAEVSRAGSSGVH